ncbi:MAG: DUF2793 domain-containing protein [Paracoccus sp. (in: a-proteobacteria)]|nr:DUF2793 domain-containing protein [Paracoccus sp. (in: a-proteobacteria)]
MSEQSTARLGLPFVQPAQAQKHVTVNEALARLDAMVNPVLDSITRSTPPETVLPGACFGVPAQAGGAWSGQGGQIAMAGNGGWVFVTPLAGMRVFVADQGVHAIHDGIAWVAGALTLSPFGSALQARVIEGEVTLGTGEAQSSDLVIPNAAMVIGAAARVVEPMTGSLSSWSLGTEGAPDRFGQGLGLVAGAWARGMLSQPVTYWEPQPLVLTAQGGSFTGGRVRLAVHLFELRLPR